MQVNRAGRYKRYRERERILYDYIYGVPWIVRSFWPGYRHGRQGWIDTRVGNARYVTLNLRARDVGAVGHAVAVIAG